MPERLSHLEKAARRNFAKVGVIALGTGLGGAAIAEMAAAKTPAHETASYSQPIRPRMDRATAKAAHSLERRMEHGQSVRYAGNVAIAWKLPKSKHRFEYLTETPLTAKIHGEMRYFTVTAASTENGRCKEATVVAIPERSPLSGEVGPGPLPPTYPAPPHVTSHQGQVWFEQNDPQPEITLRYSDGSFKDAPLAQTRDIAANNIVS